MPFAFAVPIDESIPDPATFSTRADMDAWLEDTPSLTVMGTDPSIDIAFDDAGDGCATLTAHVDPTDLSGLVSDTSVLSTYAESDGLITVKLSAKMEGATVQ